jgi:hypothetical protein
LWQEHNPGGLRAFADAQETWNGGSQQEDNDQENDRELDYREKVLNVFMPRHSCKKDAHWGRLSLLDLGPILLRPGDPIGLMPEMN